MSPNLTMNRKRISIPQEISLVHSCSTPLLDLAIGPADMIVVRTLISLVGSAEIRSDLILEGRTMHDAVWLHQHLGSPPPFPKARMDLCNSSELQVATQLYRIDSQLLRVSE
jgi:hypothetical protein